MILFSLFKTKFLVPFVTETAHSSFGFHSYPPENQNLYFTLFMYFAHRIQNSWNCEFHIFTEEIPMKLECILKWEFLSFILKANHPVYHFIVLMHEMQGTYANFNTVNSTRKLMHQIWKCIESFLMPKTIHMDFGWKSTKFAGISRFLHFFAFKY